MTLDRLGFYTLAGAPRSPRDLIGEVHDAERLGLGWVFISERFNIKEAATLSGAVEAGQCMRRELSRCRHRREGGILARR